MADDLTDTTPSRLKLSSLSVVTISGLAVACATVLLTSTVSYQGLERRGQAAQLMGHTQEVIAQLTAALSSLQDARPASAGSFSPTAKSGTSNPTAARSPTCRAFSTTRCS